MSYGRYRFLCHGGGVPTCESLVLDANLFGEKERVCRKTDTCNFLKCDRMSGLRGLMNILTYHTQVWTFIALDVVKGGQYVELMDKHEAEECQNLLALIIRKTQTNKGRISHDGGLIISTDGPGNDGQMFKVNLGEKLRTLIEEEVYARYDEHRV